VMVLQLEKAGHRCTSIRGDLDHQLRDRVVNEFRTGITKILIATDVLSRGFDVTQVLPATCLHIRAECAKG
jgi:ATP-dependent RNA helicase DDX19/DBP5